MESSNLNLQERELQQMLEEKVPLFLPTDDPLEWLNKAMALFRSTITLGYPPATIQERKVNIGKASDVSLVVTESSEVDSKKQDTSSRSGNDADTDNAYIKPIYDEEPMAEVRPLPNFKKDFSRMEAHCIALELKYQNQALKSGQHGQILNETRNKAKIKKEIDVLETMNIELEHTVAKLLKENETLKKHYKDLYDSVKITRSKTIEQKTSLLANNADLKAQI
ncbi:hypothetical protein Tco_1211180 [Tanacetum coccineum]